MKKILFIGAIYLFFVPNSVSAQNDTLSGYQNIISLFENVLKTQPFISQMKGDTLPKIDSLPFYWEVSMKTGMFCFGKGGNLFSQNKTAWYSVKVPKLCLEVIWDFGQYEGTIYSPQKNIQIEKVNGRWQVVAIFRKK